MEVKILSVCTSCCRSEGVCKECSQHLKMEAVVSRFHLPCRRSKEPWEGHGQHPKIRPRCPCFVCRTVVIKGSEWYTINIPHPKRRHRVSVHSFHALCLCCKGLTEFSPPQIKDDEISALQVPVDQNLKLKAADLSSFSDSFEFWGVKSVLEHCGPVTVGIQ